MPQTVTKVILFVASPSDVQQERDSTVEVVAELNKGIGRNLSLFVQRVTWETHCYPAMGRSQGVINAQIGDYDIFVGIMWKRFGTPTGQAESGTEKSSTSLMRNGSVITSFRFFSIFRKQNTHLTQSAKQNR